MFLDLAQQNDMTFFFGTYDSVTRPERERTIQEHLDLGRAVVDEVWERYGGYPLAEAPLEPVQGAPKNLIAWRTRDS